ncbi:hypothetical protein SLNSH_13355 [Alsobacter soli]|uniref:Uncharacterized protein n=1 Tax=Alsobacter soli TaxID=2109933 RepID=A0A2T1HS35_9HYPH|nr:hypothetical protein SLNSH_13355 [Alsobacter soli]
MERSGRRRSIAAGRHRRSRLWREQRRLRMREARHRGAFGGLDATEALRIACARNCMPRDESRLRDKRGNLDDA